MDSNNQTAPKGGKKFPKWGWWVIGIVGAVALIGAGWWVAGSKYKAENQKLKNQLSSTSSTTTSTTSSSTTSIKKTSLTKSKVDGFLEYYNGSIVVSGKFVEYANEIGICFYVDSETAYLIPRDLSTGNGDIRGPWFCFSNQDQAREMFGNDNTTVSKGEGGQCIEGVATIEVSNYAVNTRGAAVWDLANLDKIVSTESIKSAQCQSIM